MDRVRGNQTKNNRQLRNAESERQSPGKSVPIGYPVPNGNIHVSTITQTEQIVLVITEKERRKRVINLKESWDESMGGFRRKKGGGE